MTSSTCLLLHRLAAQDLLRSSQKPLALHVQGQRGPTLIVIKDISDRLSISDLFETSRLYLAYALYFSFPIALGLSNLILALLLFQWCATFKKTGQWKDVIRLPISWALGGLFGIVLIGLIYTSATPAWYLLHLGKYARLLYALVLMCLLWGNPKAQRASLNGFSVAMLFILASTWLNVWFVLPWSETKTPGWGVSHHVFGDYITQNVMMSFFAVLLLHRSLAARVSLIKIGYFSAFVLAFISITHLSAGRTGYLLLGTGLTAYFLVSAHKIALWRGALFLLGMGTLVFTTSEVALSRLNSAIHEIQMFSSEKTSSIGHRLYNYTTTPKIIAESPIVGHGTGSYHTEICRFLEHSKACSSYSWHPHNQFLFIGADHGLIGIFAFASIIVCMFAISLRSSDAEGKMLLATLAAMFFVDSLINSPLWSSRESQFFMYMLALLVCMASRRKTLDE